MEINLMNYGMRFVTMATGDRGEKRNAKSKCCLMERYKLTVKEREVKNRK